MSKLVRLKDTKGNILYLNPDHVLLLSAAQVSGVSAVGETAVVLINGLTLSTPGTTDEVNDKLEGKSGLL